MKKLYANPPQARHTKNRVPKMLALLAAGLLPAMAAQAQTAEPVYVFKMDAQTAKTVSWVTVGYAYGAWGNTGGHHSCAAWTPAENTVNWGETFSQTRICAQSQIRTKTEQQINPVTKETRLGTVTYENRNVPASEVQPGTGNLDYITGEARLGWSGWSNNGEPYDCSDWEPLPETQPLYDHYQQSRNCSQGQLRSEAVVNTWKSGKQTPKRTDTEDQIITVAQQQAAVGAKDYISGQRIAPWSAWVNDGALTSCGSWTPSATSQTVLTDFSQSLLCQQPQSSNRDVFDVWRSGLETLNRNEPRSQTVDNTQYRTVSTALGSWANTGTANCGSWSPAPTTQTVSFTQNRSCDQNQSRTVTYSADGQTLHSFNDSRTVTAGFTDSRTVTVSWSSWMNDGGLISCGSWGPAATTQTAAFTQSRSCSQKQKRTRTYSTGETFEETQTLTGQTDSRTVTVSWTAWANSGAPANYSAWSPAPTSQTADFAQSRSFDQVQSRTRSYSSGESFTENQTTRPSENRTVTASATSWSNTSTANCGSWSPAATSQTSSFTQSRICDQNQSRTWTYKAPDGTVLGTYIQSQTLSGGFTDSRTVTVSWSAWANSGTPTNYSAWSPAPTSQTADFAQSRSFDQVQSRTRSYSSGESFTENQTTRPSENRTVTASTTSWSNTSTANCGSWSPAATSQTSSFTQSRICDQNQSRTWTYKAPDGTVLGTYIQSQTLSGGFTDSRTVTVSWSSWMNDGGLISCGSWSPAATTQTAAFTQSRSCSQKQKRTRTYSTGETFEETQTLTGQTDSRTVTVSWTAWSDTGSPYSCSSWSPSTSTVNWGQSFTQSRSCTQATTRNRVYSSGESFPESSTRSVTLTQQATGSKDYIVNTTYGSWSGWSNVGGTYNCGSYSPATSTVNWGQSFTQSRSCSQDRTRSRSVTYVYASGATASGGTQSDSTVASVTDTRSATGTKDYVTGSSTSNWSSWSNSGGLFNCSSWSPDPSTVNLGQGFTQSRSCSQTQTRTRTVTPVYASGATGTATTESGSQTITVSDSQQATGTKNYVTGQTTGAWSSWSNSGGLYNCGFWSPDPSTVTSGQAFTQSAPCSQNQTRTQPVYDVYANGAMVQTNTNTGSQTVSATGTRTAYGTKQVTYYWVVKSVSGSCTEPNDPDYGTCSTKGATMQGGICLQGNRGYSVTYVCQ